MLPSSSLLTLSQWTTVVVDEKNKMMGETKLVGFGDKVLDDNEVVLVLLFTL